MMFLTPQRRTQRDPNQFPTVQLFFLAICRLAEPIALTSVFPYAYPMVKQFQVGTEQSASFWAGVLISAFALAEAMTGLLWGSLSDRIGRKPVLLMGCAGTLLSLLIVGFSTNFWLALLGRALGGILNGNIGVIQTMVGELVHRPEHEPRAYAVMPFVWSIGTIIGPAIGGTLANPASTFPYVFSPNGVFGKFPYLLPNLICALLLLISITLGWLFLDETHPDLKPWTKTSECDHADAQTPLMATAGATAHSGINIQDEAYGTFNRVSVDEGERWVVNADGSARPGSFHPDISSAKEKVFTSRVITLVVALGIFTYHSMSYDHLLPIFLQDERVAVHASTISPFRTPGGLGLTTQNVGFIMSIDGVIALIIQGVFFPIIAGWLGVFQVFMLVTILHPIAYFIVPYLAVVPATSPVGLYAAIFSCLTIRNLFSILAYPTLLILLKEAAPSMSVLGKINGLAASAGAACRTVAPPVAGFFYGLGDQIGFTGLAWWVAGTVAVVGSLQCLWVERDRQKTAHVTAAVRCVAAAMPEEEELYKDEIYITVQEV